MAFIPATFNPNFAHLKDDAGNVFQVLNESGDDLDQVATIAQQEQFNTQGKTV